MRLLLKHFMYFIITHTLLILGSIYLENDEIYFSMTHTVYDPSDKNKEDKVGMKQSKHQSKQL